MTKDEKEKEINRTGSGHLPSRFTREITDLTQPISKPQFSERQHLPESQVCNFGNGAGDWAIDKIVKRGDTMDARERIRNDFEEGRTVKEILKQAKRVAAGVLVSAGKHCIG